MNNNIPETIDELKKWYEERNLPPEDVTRFFIGKDYTGARAFGIYFSENTEEFIVYKNKSDGTRVIRYKGRDEAFAVRELYLKLKDEILKQKQRQENRINSTYENKKYSDNIINKRRYNSRYNNRYTSRYSSPVSNYIITAIVIVFFVFSTYFSLFSPKRGYYRYNNDYYYYQNGYWYEYTNRWNRVNTPSYLRKHYRDYYTSYYYDPSYYIDDFQYSGYYIEPSTSSSDSDSDWSSSDSWDSDSTDWDSDW